MFKKRVFLTLIFILTSYLTVGHFMFRTTNRSRLNYAKMVEALKPDAVEHYGATKRNKVIKDLWVNNKGHSYHYIILCEDSILHLNQERTTNTNVQEQMSDMTCYLQQKKYYLDSNGQESLASANSTAMQQVCVLKIKEGRYDFTSKDFIGTDVKMAIYQLPGHELSDQISVDQAPVILDGICDQVHLFFKNDKSHLETTNLKAQIFAEKKLL